MSDQAQDRVDFSGTASGLVECLGMTFSSEQERRDHFSQLLREKLAGIELRRISGFPEGDIEAILAMSDAPYYTACPNPWLSAFVREHGSPHSPDDGYHREPFAVDVSEGKTDQLYKAHSYHTKVPHLAIIPSILHYTEPGDVVLDGFAGSGMTGLAARLCASPPKDFKRDINERWRAEGHDMPTWGPRFAVQSDLSPVATFIGSNYTIPFDLNAFAATANQLLDELASEMGWMYETTHTDGRLGRINYVVWSEVFGCPECGGEINFIAEALDKETKKTAKSLACPSCGVELTKRQLERTKTSVFDALLNRTVEHPKREPVLINYSVSGDRFEKEIDDNDREILRRVEAASISDALPTIPMMNSTAEDHWGDEWRAGTASFTHIHHLFLPRAARVMGRLWELAERSQDARHRHITQFFAEQAIWGMSTMARYAPTHYSQVNQYMSGRIRVLSQHAECSPWYILEGKLKRLQEAFSGVAAVPAVVVTSTGDCADLPLEDDSIDYVFTDPPFGHNFAYAELNFLIESFHGVFTNQAREAIVSQHQRKKVLDYQDLMRSCFAEYRRVLKPGRWMTVVFSNSSNAVWHAIQEAMGAAGFVVADVRTLDKQQGTFNQVQGFSVNQDLVITAYKPSATIEFALSHGAKDSAWQFAGDHLAHAPVTVGSGGHLDVVLERTRQMLYDRMVGAHVQRGVAVPVSVGEFKAGLAERFPERDSMFFLPAQVADYDRKRMKAAELRQLSLFVSDESSAIQWVRQLLQDKPLSFQDLQPQFMKQLQQWSKHEAQIELRTILEQNFLRYEGTGPVPSQVHSYLSTNFAGMRNKAKEDLELRAKASDRWYVPDPAKEDDLQQLRSRALLKQFEGYANSTAKRLKEFRTEAVRAGFKDAYDRDDYATIVAVAEKLPDVVLQEDDKLLMYYDVAQMRIGA